MYKNKPDPKDKFQYYFCELYPDSAPEDWLFDLRMFGRAFAVSPLHDKDLKPDGTPKKPHYHILLDWGNTTTYRTVEKLWTSYNQPFPLACSSPRGCFEYMWHKNDPDKYPYDPNEVQCYNGFDPQVIVSLSKTEIDCIMRKIEAYIYDNHVTEYTSLVWLVPFDDWRKVISSHTVHFKALCDGLRFQDKEKEQKLHRKMMAKIIHKNLTRKMELEEAQGEQP